MKHPRVSLLGLMALLAVTGGGAERLPVAEFARTPAAARMRLSPDGKRVAFLRDVDGRSLVHVSEVDTGQLSYLDVGGALLVNDQPKEVAAFSWIGDHRLVLTTTVNDAFYGVIAVDDDGDHARPLSGYETNTIAVKSGYQLFANEIIHRFEDEDQNILMLDRHVGGAGSFNRPDILKVNTATGLAKTVVRNPGEVASWGLDFAGRARLGILSHGDLSGAIYREDEKSPWRTILPLQDRTGQLRPVGFDPAGGRVWVAALTKEERWTVFPLDPADGKLGEPLVTDPEYDILPERVPTIDGLPLAAPIFSRASATLVGMRYLTDAPRVKWFDPAYARNQAAMDRARPDTVNLLVDESRDGKRQLWFGYADQQPGVYTLLDVEKRSLKQLASCRPWLPPAKLGPTLAVKYTARDGLVIHGFLTVPAGHEPKGLPLVVMPHGGPWVRDVWGFDPLGQLLANRGYAVLQMNYRGSPGYGEALYRKARREIGRKIQDDIEDATRWAIAAGVADARRIAIIGASYGGYSALFALGHQPELYRCGVSLAGVTDWMEIFDDRKSDPGYRNANRHWRREIGDPDKDGAFLRAVSPVNFADRIVAPVLIVQGKEDQTVPPEQARLMIKALEQAGRKPQSLLIGGLGHSFGDERRRGQVFAAVVEFLEKNLGPGAP